MTTKWPMVPLNEIAEIVKGVGSYTGLPYIGLEDMESNSGRILGSLEPRTVKSQTFRFDDGHVLYGRLRPYLNKFAVPEFAGHCSTEIFPIRPHENLDRRFLAYWLSSPSICQRIDETCTGARMPRANMEKVMGFEFPLPPLDEQKRIVAKLDAAMALISGELNVLARKQGEQRVLRGAAIGNLFDSVKLAPHKSLESLVEPDSPVTYGVVKPGPEGTVPLVRSGDLLNEVIDVANLRTITQDVHEEYRRTMLRGGEVIIGLVGVPGAAAIAPAELAGANIARQVALVRTGNELSGDFLRHWINSNVGREVLKKITQGSVQQVINLSDLRKVELPVPSMADQEAISARADQINYLIQDLHRRTESISKSMRELQETILASAFAGEL